MLRRFNSYFIEKVEKFFKFHKDIRKKTLIKSRIYLLLITLSSRACLHVAPPRGTKAGARVQAYSSYYPLPWRERVGVRRNIIGSPPP
jgi:hypothetical protein